VVGQQLIRSRAAVGKSVVATYNPAAARGRAFPLDMYKV